MYNIEVASSNVEQNSYLISIYFVHVLNTPYRPS